MAFDDWSNLDEYEMKKMIIAKPMLLPPAQDKCQECAVKHDPLQPHDATSLFYLVKFKMQNNREATWDDALSHCADDIKRHWRTELAKLGIDTASIYVRGGDPITQESK